MTWKLKYLPEAQEDLAALDDSIWQPVIKGIRKVQKNPVSKECGGYGTPLGNMVSVSCINLDIRMIS